MRVLAVVAGVVVLAACGSDADPGFRAFQKGANAICLRYHHRLARLGPPATLAKIARVARGAARLGVQERKALRALDPPDDATGDFEQMLAAFDRTDALLPAVRRAAKRKDAARTRVLVERGRAHVAAANVHANELGLTDCRRD